MPTGGNCAHRGKGVLIIVASKGHPVKEFFLYLLYIRRGNTVLQGFLFDSIPGKPRILQKVMHTFHRVFHKPVEHGKTPLHPFPPVGQRDIPVSVAVEVLPLGCSSPGTRSSPGCQSCCHCPRRASGGRYRVQLTCWQAASRSRRIRELAATPPTTATLW